MDYFLRLNNQVVLAKEEKIKNNPFKVSLWFIKTFFFLTMKTADKFLAYVKKGMKWIMGMTLCFHLYPNESLSENDMSELLCDWKNNFCDTLRLRVTDVGEKVTPSITKVHIQFDTSWWVVN